MSTGDPSSTQFVAFSKNITYMLSMTSLLVARVEWLYQVILNTNICKVIFN